jgi:CheY-like chemotaxis protein
VSTKKQPAKANAKVKPAKKTARPPKKTVSTSPKKPKAKAVNPKSTKKSPPAPKKKSPPPHPKKPKTITVTAKIVKTAAKPVLASAPSQKSANILHAAASAAKSGKTPGKAADALKPAEAASLSSPSAPKAASSKAKSPKTTLDDLALDIDEKDDLLEEEKRDLIKALRDDEDEPLETAFVPTDTSERFILVVDEEGQRRNETVTIVQQILPNAVVEVADDPEEALEVMQEADFDTYVVNFLMPGYSASPFVKSVANHPDHPLLIGFAADKISDALDQRKGLKIIPLKRLFDLDVNTEATKDKSGGAED